MDQLKGSTPDSLASKKLLFKIYRDQSRLYALKRKESNANDYFKKAQRILKEELIPFKK